MGAAGRKFYVGHEQGGGGDGEDDPHYFKGGHI